MADNSGLTQDDFRRLMQTPRPHSSQSSTIETELEQQQSARPAKKSIAFDKTIAETKGEFARPRPRSRKPRNNDIDDDNETLSSAKYRDRAKERREGINPDYAESERILANLASDNQQLLADLHHETQDAETSERLARQEMEERFKLLGGDVSHTHLVKGLDYSLLDKRRREIKQDDTQDDNRTIRSTPQKVASKVADIQTSSQDEMKIRTGLARNIHAIAVSSLKQPPTLQLNELFRYGRMAYTFQLDETRSDGSRKAGDAWNIPTAVIRSKGEGQVGMRGSGSAANDLVISKICGIIEDIRTGTRVEPSSLRTAPKTLSSTVSVIKEKLEPNVTSTLNALQLNDGDDDDEDIFADVGRDYECIIDEDDVSEDIKDNDDDDDISTNIPMNTKQSTDFVNTILQQATQGLQNSTTNSGQAPISALKRKLASKPTKQLGFDVTDRDAIDYDTFGLGVNDDDIGNGSSQHWTAKSRLAAAAAAEMHQERQNIVEDADHTLDMLAGFAPMKSTKNTYNNEDDDNDSFTRSHSNAIDQTDSSQFWPNKEERDLEAREEARREQERDRRQRLRKSRKFNKDTQEINQIMTAKFGHGLCDDDDDKKNNQRKKRRKDHA
ncbi:RED-like protein N-terminal region-domain-containing protein [Syncephalis fuscata]|nr:RED-like protein N-terminal region-domain-containing protein [Syncephalis fuscata]